MVFFAEDPSLGRDAIGAVQQPLVISVAREVDPGGSPRETARFDLTRPRAADGSPASGGRGEAAARPA